MSNREVKYLFENWRKFIVKEAADNSTAPVNIFDFDNTIISVKDFLGPSYGPSNHYMSYLNVAGLEKLYANMAKNVKVLPTARLVRASIKKNPQTTYIFSMVTGAGFGATRDQFIGYLTKGDKAFINFCNLILQVDDTDLAQFKSAEPFSDQEDADYDEEAEYDDSWQDQDFEDRLDEADISSKSPEEIVDAYFTFPEAGEKEDPTEVKMSIKKQLITKICSNKKVNIQIDEQHIIVDNNLAKGAEMGGVEKGTSGKVKGASSIAERHPNADAYKVYDNSGVALAQIKKGVGLVKKATPTEEQAARMKELDAEIAAATSEKKKKSLMKDRDNVAAEALNIELYKINPETNKPEREYFTSLSHSTGGVGSTERGTQTFVNKLLSYVVGNNFFSSGKKKKFTEYTKQFPEIAAIINYVIDADLAKYNSPEASGDTRVLRLGRNAEKIPTKATFSPEKMEKNELGAFIEKLKPEITKFSSGLSKLFADTSAAPVAPEVQPEPAAEPQVDEPTPEEVPEEPAKKGRGKKGAAPEEEQPKPVKTKGTAKKTLEKAGKHVNEEGVPLFENRLYEMVVKNLKKKGILR